MAKDKPPILGLIQRGSQVVLRMLANVQQATIKPVITAAVAPGTLVHTDEYSIYARLPAWGYRHKTVCHGSGEYACDEDGDGSCDVHVNTMEMGLPTCRQALDEGLETPPYALRWSASSRPVEHSAVFALSRTLRAGASRRCRFAASWTALARGARLQAGRDHDPAGQVASNLIKPRAVLATVKTVSRRLWRWPAASLDRRSARRPRVVQAGTEKRRSRRTKKLEQHPKSTLWSCCRDVLVAPATSQGICNPSPNGLQLA